jgi:hypothetical protein
MCVISDQVNHRHGVPPSPIIAHRGRLRDLPAEKRALLALDLVKGPTRAKITHAAKAVGLSASYVHTALHATDEERDALASGRITLASLHNRPRPKPISWPLSDFDLERVITGIGIGRVLDALDRMTAPQPVLEAAE